MKDLEKFFSSIFEKAIKKLDESNHKKHTHDIAYKETNDLRNAANKLYMHRWSCDTLPPNEQMKLWSDLRDALGLSPGTATAAGVAAPAAEAGSNEVVAWYVECPEWPPRALEYESDAIRLANSTPNEVLITPLVRQGSQGVRVTLEQRNAVRDAAIIAQNRGHYGVARRLDGLLAAIDAAKGGGA